jgi:hypothetical protein
MKKIKKKSWPDNTRILINYVILVLVVIGCFLSFTSRDSETLMARGFKSLRYFTVESNIFAGLIAVFWIVFSHREKSRTNLEVLKLVSSSAVGITFLTVVAFLGPLYGYSRMYHRANFFFHLVIPVMAMAEFVFFNKLAIETKKCVFCILPVLIYGIGYIINMLVNGIESGDWYGFVNWGFYVGLGIFAGICLTSYILGVILRIANVRYRKRRNYNI